MKPVAAGKMSKKRCIHHARRLIAQSLKFIRMNYNDNFFLSELVRFLQYRSV